MTYKEFRNTDIYLMSDNFRYFIDNEQVSSYVMEREIGSLCDKYLIEKYFVKDGFVYIYMKEVW